MALAARPRQPVANAALCRPARTGERLAGGVEARRVGQDGAVVLGPQREDEAAAALAREGPAQGHEVAVAGA